MTTPESSSTMSVVQMTGKNGGMDNYIFTLKNYNEMEEGDYIKLYIPNEVKGSNYTTCSPRTGVKGFYKCKFDSPNKMTIAFMFSRGLRGRMLGSIAAGGGFDFMLVNLTNPPSLAPTSQFIFEIYSVDDYLIGNITSGPTVANTKAGSINQIFIKPSIYSDG